MTSHILTALAVRVAGIFMGLYALRNGALYIGSTVGGSQSELLMVLAFLLMTAASLLMIFFPLTLAGKILPDDLAPAKTDSLSSEEIEYLASSLLGLYFFVEAIIHGFYILGILLGLQNMGLSWSWTQEYTAIVMAMIAELFAALWLLFGSKGLWRAVRWARDVGKK
ncbi:MAG: hypothetical protein GY927_01305 [bacterium]|nr:hypothetical protein [bacterium]